MDANVTTLVYLLYRLMPFILVGNFIVSSVINGEVKGFVYAIGLIFTYFVTSSMMGFFSSLAPNPYSGKNAKCSTFSVNGLLTPSISPGIIVFAYTFGYLFYTVYQYSLYSTNLMMMILFPLLILFEMSWNYSNQCNSFTNQLILFAFSLSIGMLYSFIIDKMNMRGLQYFNIGTNSELCSRPKKQRLKCTTYKDGVIVNYTEDTPRTTPDIFAVLEGREEWTSRNWMYIDGTKGLDQNDRYSDKDTAVLFDDGSNDFNSRSDCETNCFGIEECLRDDVECRIDYDDNGDCYCKVRKLGTTNLINAAEIKASEYYNTDLTSFFNTSLDFLNAPQTVILDIGTNMYTYDEYTRYQSKKTELEADPDNVTINNDYKALHYMYRFKDFALPLTITDKYYVDPIPVDVSGSTVDDQGVPISQYTDVNDNTRNYTFYIQHIDNDTIRVIRTDSITHEYDITDGTNTHTNAVLNGGWPINLRLRARFGTSPFGDRD